MNILVEKTAIKDRASLQEDWDLIINTNFRGYSLVAQLVVPQMLEWGSCKVVNMCSILIIDTLPNQVSYAF